MDWNSPGQNTGVGSFSLLQGIFPTQGSNPGLPHCKLDSLPAELQGKPKNTGVGSLSLLQRIFLTQESSWGLLHCRWILYQLKVLIHCHLASTNGDSEQGGGETGIPQSFNLQPGLEVALTVKNLPAMQETRVQSLDWEDPLEKGMATHSSILGWRIPWTEEPGGLQSIESQRVEYDKRLSMHSCKHGCNPAQ